MFEKFRETWTKATEPIVVKMGNLDPSILTWTSLVIAIVAFVLLAEAQFDETGGLMIIGGIVLIIVAGMHCTCSCQHPPLRAQKKYRWRTMQYCAS